MIRLLRHGDTVHRDDGGAVRFDDLVEMLKAKFDGTSQWPIEAWITSLAQGGGPKKRFQYCLNPRDIWEDDSRGMATIVRNCSVVNGRYVRRGSPWANSGQ